MNLIFDLDGTLIDSRLRLYRLFQRLVPESKMSYDLYWSYKRDKISNESILFNIYSYSQTQIEHFIDEWMSLIETPEYIDIDTNFFGIHGYLENLCKQAKLHICTARQFRQPVLEQLSNLGLIQYFESIMVTEQKKNKEDLLAEIPDLRPDDWILGDTGHDITVGKRVGIKTCAVLSGFLSEKSLLPYAPDLILPIVTGFHI